MSLVHGQHLPPALHALLRGPVPQRALDWCAAAVGGRVNAVRPLAGGTSSAVHAVDAAGRALVLRRFVRADWLAEEPDAPAREARALELAAGGTVPAPALVAVDPDGEAAGEPALLMTRLPGATVWSPPVRAPFLDGLAAVARAVWATPLPAGPAPVPDYAPYAPAASRAPAWSRRPAVWARAVEAFATARPADDRRVLVHRDLHPGNVLWADGAVTGLVDWPDASVGSPAADAGHCRMNLAWTLGPEAADRFTAACGIGDVHPWWDLAAALGGFSDADLEGLPRAHEPFVAAALDRLGA